MIAQIRTLIAALLLGGLLLGAPSAQAMNAVIYQPQNRDRQVSTAQWQTLMQQLKTMGMDTLVLQWTRYGDAFASEEDQQWLQRQARIAHAAGLQIVVGLYADPDFFARQQQPDAALGNYLNRLRSEDRAQAQRWLEAADSVPVSGWYISAEVDDVNWRAPERQALAKNWLQRERLELQMLSRQPVYISSFFAGNMSPQGYSALISELSGSGVQFWIQDGRGVGKLSGAERALYLQSSAGCTLDNRAASASTTTPASGVVYEIFRALPGQQFHAEPAYPSDAAVLRSIPPCAGKDSVLFSLRYLPAAKGVLSYQ